MSGLCHESPFDQPCRNSNSQNNDLVVNYANPDAKKGNAFSFAGGTWKGIPELSLTAYTGRYEDNWKTYYLGSYYSPYYGPLQVSAGSGGMSITLGPQSMTFPLTHWDGSLFVFATTGENALGLSGAEFVIGPSGSADSLILERYNKTGLGTFTRLPGRQFCEPWRQCAASNRVPWRCGQG